MLKLTMNCQALRVSIYLISNKRNEVFLDVLLDLDAHPHQKLVLTIPLLEISIKGRGYLSNRNRRSLGKFSS